MDWSGYIGLLPTVIVGFIIWYLKKMNAKIEESIGKNDLKEYKEEVNKMTEAGIESGREARKEQQKDIKELLKDVASIEGYLSNTNGYKKRL